MWNTRIDSAESSAVAKIKGDSEASSFNTAADLGDVLFVQPARFGEELEAVPVAWEVTRRDHDGAIVQVALGDAGLYRAFNHRRGKSKACSSFRHQQLPGSMDIKVVSARLFGTKENMSDSMQTVALFTSRILQHQRRTTQQTSLADLSSLT